MDDVSVNWDGWDEAFARLKAIGKDVSAKAVQSSLNSAMKPVQDEAKARLVAAGHIQTGLLLRSIIRQNVQSSKDSWVAVRVGVDVSLKGRDLRGNKRWPVKYGYLVHKQTPFLEDAMNANAGDILNKALTALEKKVTKYEKL